MDFSGHAAWLACPPPGTPRRPPFLGPSLPRVPLGRRWGLFQLSSSLPHTWLVSLSTIPAAPECWSSPPLTRTLSQTFLPRGGLKDSNAHLAPPSGAGFLILPQPRSPTPRAVSPRPPASHPSPAPAAFPDGRTGSTWALGGGGGAQKQPEVIFKNKSRECPWLEDFCFLRRRADRWPFKAETWEQPRLNWKTAGEAAGMANSFSPLRGMFLKP